MRIDLPVSGIVSELIYLGIALIIEYGGADPAGPGVIEIDQGLFKDSLPEIIRSVLEQVDEKVKDFPGTKVAGNDKNSYNKAYLTNFGINLPEGITYPALFRDVSNRTADLIKGGKLNPVNSIRSIDGNFLGVKGPENFIMPSIIKQMEFYEKSTVFMKPTTGPKSMIEMDPFWFTLLSLGFLWGYSGYYGGAYYITTYPGIEARLEEHSQILDTINMVSYTNLRSKRRLDKEEVYELGLSLDIALKAESSEAVSGYRWPVRLYKEAVVGQAYTAEKSLDLNLGDMINFMIRYASNWRKLSKKPTVKLNNREVSPLEALIALAERELSSNKGVRGDNEMVAYLLVKDIHRAISSGKPSLMEETLYRAARKSRGARESGEVDGTLSYTLYTFFSRRHLEVLLGVLNELS